MLVLTRKMGEAICIGDEIELIVTEITKNAVRVGIKAPRNTTVYRKEVYERILLENQEAQSTVIDINNSQLAGLSKLINKRINKT
jgi:carbon storage regulator